MSEPLELRAACRAFIASAFDVLTRERVIPTSIYHRYIAVGRDYFGSSIMTLADFVTLEKLLNETYPERFAGPLTRRHPEFTNGYILSFLEACVARCAPRNDFNVDSSAVEESINELLDVLDKTAYDVVCCRHVSHLTTASGEEVQIGGITVVPESRTLGERLIGRIDSEIRGAPRAWNRQEPRPYDPPHSLLIIRESTEDPASYEVVERLSRQLERFLLVARLLTAGTIQSTYEVSGTTTLVTRMHPLMNTFGKGSLDLLVRRTARLNGLEGSAFDALSNLIDAADVKREGMVATSFDVALTRFNRSHRSDSLSSIW